MNASARIAATGLIALLACGSVQAASPPNDPHYQAEGSWGQDFADQWALQQQRVYADIAPNDADQEIIVAVIDTGLDYTHTDLAAEKIWHNAAERKNGRDDDNNGYVDDVIGWNFVDDNNNPWDLSGHGTHIAGVIAACTNNGIGIAGANPQARIMPLKVANFIGQARSSAVAAAIYYAVDHGARIINLSLGGELVTELEAAAADYARQRDVLILVAAGNRGMSAEQQGYATLPGVLVVGASDLQGQRAGFSNFGSNVALLAPGVDVLSLRAKDTDFISLTNPLDYPDESAVVGEDEQYYRASGTSFATALATGVASRVLSQRPDLTNAELREALVQSAQDIDPPGVDQLSGYGQLDYIAALQAEQGAYVHARLSGAELELDDAGLWIKINGTAAAANFSGAELQLRAAPGSIPVVEEDPKDRKKKKKKKSRDQEEAPGPYDWQVITTLNTPVQAQPLGRYSITELTQRAGGSTQWEVRLQVTDANGNTRQAHMSLALPKPEPAMPEVAQDG
jgi:subtilisin family serine protease